MSQCTSNGELTELCIALGRAMYKQADRFLSAYGLTPPQFEILGVLAEEGTVPLNRLSERLCCASSNVTGVVDRLERDGLVKRVRSEKDRRVILLELTENGRQLWQSVPGRGCCGLDLDSVLDAQERAELRRLLEKLIAGMA